MNDPARAIHGEIDRAAPRPDDTAVDRLAVAVRRDVEGAAGPPAIVIDDVGLSLSVDVDARVVS
jgi:hypothetical protein